MPSERFLTGKVRHMAKKEQAKKDNQTVNPANKVSDATMLPSGERKPPTDGYESPDEEKRRIEKLDRVEAFRMQLEMLHQADKAMIERNKAARTSDNQSLESMPVLSASSTQQGPQSSRTAPSVPKHSARPSSYYTPVFPSSVDSCGLPAAAHTVHDASGRPGCTAPLCV